MVKITDYTIHMVGHGHIDPTWRWRWTEGYQEVRATFRSALERMRETPEFKFTSGSACFYDWVKCTDPAMFDEIRARVNEGRWEIAGGWWVEPDCNIPAGESFVRHSLYAQRFFDREFGVRAKVGFNPDSFGHAGTLPQILKKSGIDYYAYMRPDPREMEYTGGTTFIWRAKDGSELIACNLQEDYNGCGDVIDRVKRLADNPNLNPGQRHVLGFYGVGDHGGGPTKCAIQQLLDAQRNHARLPKVLFSSLLGFFNDFLKTSNEKKLPVIDSDLQHHARGCYSVHSEIKRLNRSCEHALITAERFASAAWLLHGREYPQQSLEYSWKDVLYNHFHDILAGTGIPSAYEDTRDQLGAARHRANVIANESLQAIARTVNTTGKGNAIIAINPLPWPVIQCVNVAPIVSRELEAPIHIVDAADVPVSHQRVRSERPGEDAGIFIADLPALGYRLYRAKSGEVNIKHTRELSADRRFLVNDWWQLQFDAETGDLIRLYDRRSKVDVLSRGGIFSCLIDDTDTWSHGVATWRVEAGRFDHARLRLCELGDVRATIRISSSYDKSSMEQFITLYRDIDTIDWKVSVNWQQRHTMLKMVFETLIKDGSAVCEAPYGVQERPANGDEQPCQSWVDFTGSISDREYGLAILNDSKYGFDIKNGVVRMTILRSPLYAHHEPDRIEYGSPYPVIDQGRQTFQLRLVPHLGPWQDARVPKKAWELNEPAFTHLESSHDGQRGPIASMIGTEADNVMLTVIKKHEDSGLLVVRGYETDGRHVSTTLHMPYLQKAFPISFQPHEIKTLCLNPQEGTLSEMNLLEEPVK